MTALLTTCYPALRPLLFCLPPEQAHDLSLRALDLMHSLPGKGLLFPAPTTTVAGATTTAAPLQQAVNLMGLELPNRVGLAAGLDKNGAHIDALGALGFGFVEVGTVTPRPQAGNPKPRLFRLPEHRALINRFGFNNDGLEVFVRNVQRSQWRQQGGILGLNIGKNADTPLENAAQDYLTGLTTVYPHADYITVNISSPNTKDLRALQEDQALSTFLAALHNKRLELAAQYQRQVPLVVKIAPDLDATQIDHIAAMVRESQFNGIIATNTTLERGSIKGHRHADQAGGLSGPPVHALSLKVIERLRAQCVPDFPIIGVGGVDKGQDAADKIRAGADAVQIFTGLIYQARALISDSIRAIERVIQD